MTGTYNMPSPCSIQEIVREGGAYYTDDGWSAEHPPGDPNGWDYCNLASGLIAGAIEKVSGEHFHAYCHTHIVQPLRMDGTYLVQEISDLDTLAVLYCYDNESGDWYARYDDFSNTQRVTLDYDRIPLGHNGSIYAPQGGVRTSALELSKLLLTFMNGGTFQGARILRPETLELMYQVHWTGYGDHGRYRQKGLHVHISENLIPGRTLLGHGAEAYGLLGDVYFDREGEFGIIVLMNGGTFDYGKRGFYNLEEDVFDAIYQELIAGK